MHEVLNPLCIHFERPSSKPPHHRHRHCSTPDGGAVPEGVAVNVRGRSFAIIADVEIGDEPQV